MQPIIDIHIHIMPYHMMKPSALELMMKGLAGSRRLPRRLSVAEMLVSAGLSAEPLLVMVN